MLESREVGGICHHDCPDSCGWVATVNDNGVATKLRGNPGHPFSQGELCPKVSRFLERVYSPDRILYPLIRDGEKGSGSFREASWDEATSLVASKWNAIIDSYGGLAIMPWSDAGTQGLLQQSSLDRRLFARIGSTRQVGSLCGATAAAGVAATYGSGVTADPLEVEHANLVILWGTNTLLTNRHLWPYIQKARNRGAELIVIDPYRTRTAGRADRHLAPRPGTDVAMMLAMMHVLIRDDLIDTGYVEAHTTGFAELADHVADWSCGRAEEITGIAAAEIESLAHTYARAKPAFIRTLIGPEHHTNGAMFFRALACLPLLVGDWARRGGGLSRSVGTTSEARLDYASFEADHLTRGRHRREYNMNHLGRTLTDPDLDPPIKSVVIWNGNPLTSVPRADLIREGLAREDLFCVVSEQLLTDTARYADVVFPATTQLEQQDVVPAWGHLWIGWNEIAIEPRGEAVPNTELWRRLAHAMGFTEPELFESDAELLQVACANVDLEEMKQVGWVRAVEDSFSPYADGGFATDDGKAHFFSSALASKGLSPLPAYVSPKMADPRAERSASAHSNIRSAQDPLKRALPGRFEPGQDPLKGALPDHDEPLILHTPKKHSRFLNSSYSSSPGHGDRERGPVVELHSVDAANRSISTGDLVEVARGESALAIEAEISDRVLPGLVSIPFGWWAQHFDGVDSVNALTNDSLTDWGGGVAYGDTLVTVRRLHQNGPAV